MRLLILPAAAVVLLLLLQVSTSGAARTGEVAGGWTPIENPSDPYVREIAEFAVKTYNDMTKKRLVLEKVVKGETQVVSGTNYRLILVIDVGADTTTYEAIVWDKPQEHFRRLMSFNVVPGNA